jgi:hypothetical protein
MPIHKLATLLTPRDDFEGMVMNLMVSPNHVLLPLTSKPQEEQYQTQATKAI